MNIYTNELLRNVGSAHGLTLVRDSFTLLHCARCVRYSTRVTHKRKYSCCKVYRWSFWFLFSISAINENEFSKSPISIFTNKREKREKRNRNVNVPLNAYNRWKRPELSWINDLCFIKSNTDRKWVYLFNWVITVHQNSFYTRLHQPGPVSQRHTWVCVQAWRICLIAHANHSYSEAIVNAWSDLSMQVECTVYVETPNIWCTGVRGRPK